MIKFLFKGILRDKSRSLSPIIVITIGVVLTVMLSGLLKGMLTDMIDQNAWFETGHVKVMSREYAKNKDQLPNDLALLGVDTLMQSLQKEFPFMNWVKRIRFGGLIDVPDAQGNSKGQGPASGMAIDLFSPHSVEARRLNIAKSLVTGSVPSKKGESIIGNEFAEKLHLKLGDEITYIGSTMNGEMSFKNFRVSGTIRFGVAAMDKGAVIIDITDAQEMLDMSDGAGELLGFFNSGIYNDKKAQLVTEEFNEHYVQSDDNFAPIMFRLKEQNNLSGYLDFVNSMSTILVSIFVFAMSIVLWNTGLLGGLRRYYEFGIRLALGESKGHIYRSLILEAILIGTIGSIIGSVIGLAGTWYMQVHGLDLSGFLKNATSMMMPSILRSQLSPELIYIGFIPGLLAMVLGNMLSGIGIYKRETATLFKELEV